MMVSPRNNWSTSIVTGLRVATEKPRLVSTVAYYIELDPTHRSYHLMTPRRQSNDLVYKNCQINWAKGNHSLTISLVAKWLLKCHLGQVGVQHH
jgi:hypothetical protein